jgi:hypothetical protein
MRYSIGRSSHKWVSITLALVMACGVLTASTRGAARRDQDGDKPQAGQAQGKGKFKAVYGPINNKDYAVVQTELKKEKALEAIADGLNQEFALPVDVTLTFTECKEINAFYSPDRHQISMCYELLEHFYEIFKPDSKSEDELDDAVLGAVFFVFYHELGHALIHVLDLPVTGKEEDAVDQLSTLILADGTDEGEKAVIDGARWFMLEEDQNDTDIDHLAFWDEHSLGRQRFFNILCWLYGHDEKKYDFLVKKGVLPGERAERCSGEYAQIDKSWNRLLGPYMKN